MGEGGGGDYCWFSLFFGVQNGARLALDGTRLALAQSESQVFIANLQSQLDEDRKQECETNAVCARPRKSGYEETSD